MSQRIFATTAVRGCALRSKAIVFTTDPAAFANISDEQIP
jgi:hypothetical protein